MPHRYKGRMPGCLKEPRVLDLFCGEGGCTMGYKRAGFVPIGVDHKPQSRYPGLFVQDENVDGAPMQPPSVMLCGLMFGLKVFRHRWFESSELLLVPEHPSHRGKKLGKDGMCCVIGHGSGTSRMRRYSGKDDIRLWAARFPEMIDKVRAWEAEVGKTFFRSGLPGGKWAGIDEMVAWSKTLHGGKRMALPFVEAEAAAGGCSSKYGVCE